MNLDPLLSRVWIRRLLIFTGWTLIGLFFSTQIYLMFNVGEGRQLSWLRAIVSTVPDWYEWALLSMLIAPITRRIRLDRSNWQRAFIIHFGLSLVFAGTHVLLAHTVTHLFGWGWGEKGAWLDKLKINFFWYFYWDVVTYWAIVCFCYAVNYYRSFEERKVALLDLEAQLAQAQLQALKMQLHPHFLFNTLNSISVLMNKDVPLAKKMIARLGEFLRLTLRNSGAQEVLLQEELDFLKCYLDIEKVRFQDRLTVNMEIDPSTVDLSVPNLILQPIIENAIRHGIGRRAEPGHIDIRATRENGTLQLQVQDDGPGITQNALQRGVGLSNTQARLERLYGPSHRFDISNAPQGGLIVTLEIPVHRSGENDAKNERTDH